MADTVDVKTVFSGRNRHVLHLTNISDGTGESGVVKLDISTLVGPDGTPPTKTVIEELQWSIRGFSDVRLFWDHDVDDEIDILAAGSGYFNYIGAGGLVDPGSTGGTGDIILTTSGTAVGNTYDITISLRLKD
jgi:hypothetical protein